MADEDQLATIRRKSERMRRGRRQRDNIWSYLANVGVLGWLFIVPVIAFVLLGRWIGDQFGHDWHAIIGLLIGLFVGAGLAWRAVSRAIDEPEPLEPPQERPPRPEESEDE